MDLASFERFMKSVRRHLAVASRCRSAGDEAGELKVATALEVLVRSVVLEPSRAREVLLLIQSELAESAFCDIAWEALFASRKSAKPNVAGRKAGGAVHKSGTRSSTKAKHEEGIATKRKSFGGEKGDGDRRLPRRKPKGWSGPWPPISDDNPESSV